jgi:hypothetical protein
MAENYVKQKSILCLSASRGDAFFDSTKKPVFTTGESPI